MNFIKKYYQLFLFWMDLLTKVKFSDRPERPYTQDYLNDYPRLLKKTLTYRKWVLKRKILLMKISYKKALRRSK